MFDPPNELLGVCTRRVLCLKGVFLVDDVLWSVFIFNTFPKVLFFLPVLFFLLVFVVFFMGIAGFCGESAMVVGLGIAVLALVEAVAVAVVAVVVAVVAVGTTNREESGDAL